jgi:hypothetical protein
MFGSTSKRITKLTDKAKAALEGSSKKQKNDASSMTSTSEPKKAKPNQISGNSKDRDTEPLSPSPSAEDVPTKEAAIEISDTDQSSNDGVNNADNDNEDEPSDTDKEESPEDELSELNQFQNNFGVNDIREVNERLDLTGVCFFQSQAAHCHHRRTARTRV